MSPEELMSAPIEDVRAFIDRYAEIADLSKPEVVATLHAAKNRVMREIARATVAAMRAGLAAAAIFATSPTPSEIPLQVPPVTIAPVVLPYHASADEIAAAEGTEKGIIVAVTPKGGSL